MDVYWIDFSPSVGQEIRKIHPGIIVSPPGLGKLRLKIVVPITNASGKPHPWHVLLQPSLKNGLTKQSVADCFQIKSISDNRMLDKIGSLSKEDELEIKKRLILVLGLV